MFCFKNLYKHVNTFFLALLLTFSPSVSAQIRDWNDVDGNKTTCLVNGVPTLKCLEVVTGNLLFMTNAFILLVIFIMFVIGSFKYLTSLGDQGKMESAKGTFTWAVVGLVVYLSAYLILNIIDILFLGGQGQIFQFRIGE